MPPRPSIPASTSAINSGNAKQSTSGSKKAPANSLDTSDESSGEEWLAPLRGEIKHEVQERKKDARGGSKSSKKKVVKREGKKEKTSKKKKKKVVLPIVDPERLIQNSDFDSDSNSEEVVIQPPRDMNCAAPRKKSNANRLPPRSTLPEMTDDEWLTYKIKWKHIKGRWRKSPWDKRNPHVMTAARKRLETMYNPLIKLLGTKIIVVRGDEDEGEFIDTDSDRSDDTDDDDDLPVAKKAGKKKRADKVNKADEGNRTTRVLESDSGSDEDDAIKREDSMDIDLTPKLEELIESEPSSPDVKLNNADASEPEPDTEEEEVDDDEKPVVVVKEEEEEKDELALAIEQKLERDREAETERISRERKKLEAQKEMENRKLVPFKAKYDDVMVIEEVDDDLEGIVAYPVEAKTRPHLEILDAAQARTGKFVLAPGVEIPAAINQFLRSYQQEGVQFLYRQYEQGIGGILGDDMGLGKTIQVIAFLSALTKSTGHKTQDAYRRAQRVNAIEDGEYPPASSYGPTCLIACPSSLVLNWAREIQKWSYLEVAVYKGTERNNVVKRFRMGYYDVVIASLDGVRNEIAALTSLDFSIVIIDEIHRIKNVQSGVATAFRKFPTLLRYGLTGTAFQNRYEEFRGILDWTNPDKVGTKMQWKLFVSDPFKFGQSADATSKEIITMRLTAEAFVHKLLPNFFLRRTKAIIADRMPLKRDNIVICPLTPLQSRVYKRLLKLDEVQAILTHEEPCLCGALDSAGNAFTKGKCCYQNWSQTVLMYILLFQKVANHVALIYPDKRERLEKPEIYAKKVAYVKAAFDEDDGVKRTFGRLAAHDESLCGKWLVLQRLLELWHKQGDKVLIFSQSLQLIEMLKILLDSKLSHDYVVLEGKMGIDERMEAVDRFNQDKDVFVFLLSVMAGGTGLNLTAANKVVIFDPSWNPATDLQAMDRAFRMGQTRNVDVYRMVGAGTLEELIYNRQQYKRAQANIGYDGNSERRIYSGVEGVPDQQGELFGVKNLFKLHENYGLTKEIVQGCDARDLEWAAKNSEVIKDGRGPVDADGIDVDEPAKIKDDEEESVLDKILAGTFSIVSDKTLGGSAAEARREQEILEEYEQQRKSTKKAAGKRSIDFVSGKNEFSKDSKYSSGDDEERIPGYIRKKKRKSR